MRMLRLPDDPGSADADRAPGDRQERHGFIADDDTEDERHGRYQECRGGGLGGAKAPGGDREQHVGDARAECAESEKAEERTDRPVRGEQIRQAEGSGEKQRDALSPPDHGERSIALLQRTSKVEGKAIGNERSKDHEDAVDTAFPLADGRQSDKHGPGKPHGETDHDAPGRRPARENARNDRGEKGICPVQHASDRR